MNENNYQKLTDEFVDSLLNCEKEIIAAPKPKDKSNYGHKETAVQLRSTNNDYLFSVFVRVNIELIENFSIGLVYHRDKESNIILIRYNGDHGPHKNVLTQEMIEGFHIHKFQIEAYEKGIRGENTAKITTTYSNLNEALLSFFRDLNVKNYSQYFPELNQVNFDFIK